MKSLQRWKIGIAMGLLALLIACAPKRNETQFSKNKASEAGQTYTEDQLRAAIGSAQYDQLVAGIGADNLNLLTYGIGISNMTQMINGISGPGKLTSLMSNGANSTKLTAIEVLDLLNKLDDACQLPGSFGTDTLGKMVNMINNVSLAGMEGVKNIVHGVTDTTVQGFVDPNGVTYNNAVARLGLMISLLNEALSVMPTLVNDLAAPRCSLPAYTTNGTCTGAGGTWTPAGVFSAVGNAKLVRLVNLTQDMRDLGVIINGTTALNNITAVMAGLNGDMYCSKSWYTTPGTCTANGGTWTNYDCQNPALTTSGACTGASGTWVSYCSNRSYSTSGACTAAGSNWISACTYPNNSTRATCTGGGGTWMPDGIENMARIINELDRVCANGLNVQDLALTNGTACLAAGKVWHTKASKVPIIVNNITAVPNMYNIVNGLSNDGKRPAWPTGLPAAYPGDAGNVFDGADSMIATLNAINVAAMGDPATANIVPFGLNGVKRLAYMVNQLDTTPVYENDSDFEGSTAPYDCVNGLFDNRLNWAFSDNNATAASPWYGKSWRSGGTTVQGGTCSLRNDNTAATKATVTQTAELIFNLTTSGTGTFYTKTDTLAAGDVLRYFIDDVLQATYTNGSGAGFVLRTTPVMATGVHRIRFDIQRVVGSTGIAYLDTMVLPGTKGASRTAAEKTAIMLNNLYIASSITNVADLLNNTTAPACIATPTTCTPTNDNGVDGLIYTVNRAEYPALISTVPRLATTVNGISNLSEMYGVLNNMNSLASFGQLVAMVDFVETPSNVPLLINSLGTGGGLKTATILTNLTAAGTSNMLRIMANTPTGAPVADIATMINGANTTGHIGIILTELPLTGNLFLGKSNTVTISNGPGLVTWGAHGYTEGSPVQFATTGKLPAPLTNGTIYYMKSVAAGSFNLSLTPGGAAIATTNAGSGTHTAYATGEQYYASPTGGGKLSLFFNQMNTVMTANAQNCTTGNASQFCLKNHMVRLVNDIAASAAGPVSIAQIVGGMRPDNGPGTSTAAAFCAAGCPGVTRMVNVMYDVRTMDAGTCTVGGVNQGYVPSNAKCTALGGVWTAPTTQYTNGLANTTTDSFGRLTAMIADMGASGGVNTGRMVNEVNAPYMTSVDSGSPRVSYLISNINRMRFLSRLLSEMNSADLMLQLLNSANTNIVTIRNLINGQGNLAYGTNTVAADLGSFYTVGSQTGHEPVPTTTYGAGGSGLDTLGRLIQFINGITSGIENVVTLINVISDVRYMAAMNGVATPNAMPTPYNPDAGADRNCYDGTACGLRNFGYGMMNEADRVDYLSNLINGISNLDLFLTIVNGPGSCSLAFNSRSTCIGGGGTWTEGSMGYCAAAPATTTQAACGGSWVANSPVAPNSAHYSKMISIVNDVAGSTRKGTGTKVVGDISILSDVINDLGIIPGTSNPQTLANQARIITVMNDVVYCGVDPVADRRNSGPHCVNTAFTNQASCVAAGSTWSLGGYCGSAGNPSALYTQATCGGSWTAESQVLLCTQPGDGSYVEATDFYDARYRVANTMLGVNDSSPMATIVGSVTQTQKTVRLMNGFRRINAMVKIVNWLPGEATRDLVNYTNFNQINPALVYIGNNIAPTEAKAAKAFASLIFWGTTIGQGASRTTLPCTRWPAIGPRRMAGVMNTEGGQYLEGLIMKFGFRTIIPLMVCGFSPHGSNYETYGGYGGSPNWTTSGTSINPGVGGSTTCTTTNNQKCMTIPGNASSVNFKQKEELVTYGSCSNAAYHTRHSCTSNGATWTDDLTTTTWMFGLKNDGLMNANCRKYYPETASAYGHNMPLDNTVFLGANVWANTVNAGIGGVWDILKGSGLIGWLLSQSGTIGFPPNQGGGYTCTDGGSGNEYACVDNGMSTSPNTSVYRWGNQCSIPARGGTNCNANYTTCETTCKGRWINDKDFTFASCGIDPSAGVEPIQ